MSHNFCERSARPLNVKMNKMVHSFSEYEFFTILHVQDYYILNSAVSSELKNKVDTIQGLSSTLYENVGKEILPYIMKGNSICR